MSLRRIHMQLGLATRMNLVLDSIRALGVVATYQASDLEVSMSAFVTVGGCKI